MSVHSDLIAGAASPLLLDAHGESFTVQLKGADAPIELTGLVGREQTREKLVGEGRKQVKQRRFSFTTDQAGRFGGVANLPLNAKLTYGSTEYAITEKPSELNGMVNVVAERSAVKGRGDRDYRLP